MYRLARFFFFLLPAEPAHYLAMNLLKLACSISFVRDFIRKKMRPSSIPVDALGLRFRNRTGLGAGFDKNALWLRELEVLGFGFVEIGTVTPKPQAGNDKPRLFRLPADGALINRMGFNNDGVEAIVKRLHRRRKAHPSIPNTQSPISNTQYPIPNHQYPITIGGNIGKNKSTPNEEAWKDYETCFLALHPYVDFFVVNVSSPNTPGLRELQEKESLRKILVHLQNLNIQQKVSRPILLKIAPDLTDGQLDDVIALAKEISLDGIVATNTTIARPPLETGNRKLETIGPGGLSGLPLKERATEVIRNIHEKAPSIPIIGSGGVFTKADAEEKIAAGATLIEVWTGFIYVGPTIAKKVT